jgi:multimeric flavodoxin WrbA
MEVYTVKVLGIVGSPRKGGNTEIMLEEALAAAREAGAETEIVRIADKNIAPCDACYSCRKTGVCKIKDDMQPIYKQLEAADGVFFATPVYFYSVTAQLKTVIDRMFLQLGTGGMRGKVAAPIITARRVGAGQTRTLLYGFFIAQGMVAISGAIGYGREKGEVRQGVGGRRETMALEEARMAGKEIVQMIQQLAR